MDEPAAGRAAARHLNPGFRSMWEASVLSLARTHSEPYRRIRRRMIVLGIACVAIVAVGLVLFFESENRSTLRVVSLILTIGPILGGVGLAILLSPGESEMSGDVHRAAFETLATAAGLSYDPEAGAFEPGIFDDFTIQPLLHLDFSLSDHLFGSLDGHAIDMVWCLLEKGSGRTHSEGFRGLLLRYDCPVPFDGVAIAYPAVEARMIDRMRFGAAMHARKMKRYPPEFDLPNGGRVASGPAVTGSNAAGPNAAGLILRAHASDPEEGLRLFAPPFLEKLAGLPAALGGNRVEAAFANGRIHIAVGAPSSLFDTDRLLRHPDDPRVEARLVRAVDGFLDFGRFLYSK